MAETGQAPLIWLIAGEPSGDLIGARLIAALKQKTGGRLCIAGVGGEAMQAEGLDTLFPISDIAVMGLIEIIPRIPLIKRRMRETIAAIKRDKPVMVVSIDVPGFCFDVWKGLRSADIPLVHYVAPTVWAWRPDRAKKFAAELDHLMALLPFEPPYFEREGLDCTFVGHPVLEGGADAGDGTAFRVAHNIDVGATAICVLPGSRRGELRKLAGVFREAAVSIVERHPDTVFVFPTVPYLKDHVTDLAKDWPGKTVVVASIAEKFDAMQSCDVAMAASGTVSLELAMGQVPHLIAYRMNRLTIKIVKMLHGMKQKYANLVNILLDREVIPEFIQERCRSDLIAAKILELLDQPAARDRQLSSIDDALSMLRPENATPSDSAATVVLSLVDSSHQPNTQEK